MIEWYVKSFRLEFLYGFLSVLHHNNEHLYYFYLFFLFCSISRRLDSHAKRKCGTTEFDDEMTRDLTEFEAHLLKSQEVIVTRGKVHV